MGKLDEIVKEVYGNKVLTEDERLSAHTRLANDVDNLVAYIGKLLVKPDELNKGSPLVLVQDSNFLFGQAWKRK